MSNQITGILAPSHFLRDIFPDGQVPLMSANPVPAVLGPASSPSQMVYMCPVKQLSSQQLGKIAISMAIQSDSTIEEAAEHLKTVDAIPFRAGHFIGVVMPLRLFL